MSLTDAPVPSRAARADAPVQTPLLRAATILVIAIACIWFAPPLAVDGRYTHLEYALAMLGAVLLIGILGGGIRSRRLVLPMPQLLLLGLMALSVLWGFDRIAGLHDVPTFAAIFIGAVVLVHIAELRTLALGVAASGVLLLLWAISAIITDPSTALSQAGALMAPYGNKNGMAYALLTASTAAIALRARALPWALAKWVVVVALGAGILATTSRTALFTFLAALAVAGFLGLFRRNRKLALVFGAVCAAGIAAASLALGTILDALGKGSSVNGRFPIWGAVWPHVLDNPILGQGWTMAWPLMSPVSGDVRWRLGGSTTVYHAHNELLNWLVTLGIFGGLLFLAWYALLAWGGWLRTRSDLAGDPRDWLIIGFAVFLVRGLTDISETLPQGWFVVSMLGTVAAIEVKRRVSPRLGRWLAPGIRIGNERAVREPDDLKG